MSFFHCDRQLDEAGRVTLLSCVGEHMQISRECWEPIVLKYTGGTVASKHVPVQLSEDVPSLLPRPLVIQS